MEVTPEIGVLPVDRSTSASNTKQTPFKMTEERNSASIPRVSPKIYSAIQRVGVTTLAHSQQDADLRPVLASLVRMSLI